MCMGTDQLMRSLAENVRPVRPLSRPWLRTIAWAAVSALYLAVLVVVMSPRTDLGARMQDSRFVIEQVAALLTGLTASTAAFATVVPGYGDPRRVTLLPVVLLAVWIGTVAVGAQQEYVQFGGGVLAQQLDWACVGTILVGAAVPAFAMGVMLRRGAPVSPCLSAGFGGLAAAGIGNLGVCLFHPHSSDLILLVWHCGVVLVVAALAGVAGVRILRWPSQRRALRSP